MNMKLRYQGGFKSLNNIAYDVKIWQDDYNGKVTEIAFCNTPLEIEWPDTDKLEPIQSSRATLQLYSDTDRQFIDLYTIKPGTIRLDVYRNSALYWSGTLDPELYEEPFAYKDNYGVSLTFSDMAILDRLNWEGQNFMTLEEVLKSILAKSGINYTSLKEHISTDIQYPGELLLTGTTVNCDNFYDEDGEPMSLREVAEETLRPFALRMVQKAGSLIVYDLNSVYSLTPEAVHWESDDAVMGVDKVYNNVIVTFSPYHNSQMLEGKVDRESVTGGTTQTVKINDTENIDGFNITLSDTGDGFAKAQEARYFKIEPDLSGDESAGVAWTVKVKRNGNYMSYLKEASSQVGGLLLKAQKRPFLGYVSYRRSDYKMRLELDMMADVRYNPFESQDTKIGDKGYPNEQGDFNKRLKQWCNFSYVPFRLILRDTDGNALFHYENKEVATENGGYSKKGSWALGEGGWGDALLAYYDVSDRKSNTGLGGWQTNKQCIGYHRGDLPTLFHKRDDGEFIDLPAAGGWLDVQIGSGLPTFDYDNDKHWQTNQDIYWRIRWLLYRSLHLTLVDKNYKTIETKDVEVKAWINHLAKEELKIDTVLGTLKEPSPTALGQLFRTTNKYILTEFHRAGTTTQLERLLIGTIYSNYATRHNTLSGTTTLLPQFGIYTDNNELGRYILLGETQHLQIDQSEITMAQFEADNYEGVKFDE